MAEDFDTITLAAELTAAWLGNPNTRVSADDVPGFLTTMHQTIGKLSAPADALADQAPAPDYTPAVSVRKSLASPDHIISMIDGKPYRTLKRHLATNGLSPAEYRERYGLKADYPMVAPAYSEARRATAKRLGLGRKPGVTAGEAPLETTAPAAQAEAHVEPPARKRGRPAKASAAPPEAAAPEAKPRKRRSPSEAKEAARAHLGGKTDA